MGRINYYVECSKPVSTEFTITFQKYVANFCIPLSKAVIYQHIFQY